MRKKQQWDLKTQALNENHDDAEIMKHVTTQSLIFYTLDSSMYVSHRAVLLACFLICCPLLIQNEHLS